MSSTMEWLGKEDVEPLLDAKDRSLAKAQKLKTLHFHLVIQDHIESIGKANTIKRG